jgi:hypothetical protein
MDGTQAAACSLLENETLLFLAAGVMIGVRDAHDSRRR